MYRTLGRIFYCSRHARDRGEKESGGREQTAMHLVDGRYEANSSLWETPIARLPFAPDPPVGSFNVSCLHLHRPRSARGPVPPCWPHNSFVATLHARRLRRRVVLFRAHRQLPLPSPRALAGAGPALRPAAAPYSTHTPSRSSRACRPRISCMRLARARIRK